MPPGPDVPPGAARPAGGDGGEGFAPFRPRRAPVVALVVGVGVVLMMVWLALFVSGTVRWWDRAGFLVVGAAIVWFLHRQATVRAEPSRSGLHVRNLVHSRTVSWPEVTGVQFGGGRPWVQLELADGDVLAVMGVQRADGERAVAEAGRLAAYAAAFGSTGTRDPSGPRAPNQPPGPSDPPATGGPPWP